MTLTSNPAHAALPAEGPADPMARAELLAALAALHADESEQIGHLAPPVQAAFVASGLARLLAPPELGGEAAAAATLVDAIATIAAADGSTGWCVAVGMGINHLAGYLPRAGATALFSDLSEPGCGVFAPTGQARRTADGYVLTGRWAFTSGCTDAAVQACGAFVVDADGVPETTPDGAPILRVFFTPMGAINVVENWDTAGLRATGSHDTVAQAVPIQAGSAMTFADRPWSAADLYRVPPFCVLAACLASVALGIGRGALAEFAAGARAEHRQPARPGPRPRFADEPLSQLDYGRAEVRLRAATLLLVDSLTRACALGASGHLGRADVALVGLACDEAGAAAGHAVDVAGALSGSAAVRLGGRLERRRRDIDTLRKHQVFWPTHETPLARQLAGIPTVAFPFLAHPVAGDER